MWAAGGAHGWSWDEVFPYFLKSEDNRDPALAKNGKLDSRKMDELNYSDLGYTFIPCAY